MLSSARTAGMRTSEAERHKVADFLRDACADGRLTTDELEQRLDRLFAGGTVADIERLVWDLPGSHAVIPRLSVAPRTPRPVVRRRRPAPAAPLAVILFGLGLAVLVLAVLPPALALVAGLMLLAAVVTVGALAVILAPVGLLLFGLAWLAERMWRWHAAFGPPGRHGRRFR